jgi:hypothetical protein
MYDLTLELALADVAVDEPAFVLARLRSSRCSPALGKPLLTLASQHVAGMEVVLVHRTPSGDLRQFGPAHLAPLVASLDLDAQPWAAVWISGDQPAHVA